MDTLVSMSAPQETIGGRTFSFGVMPAETSFLISLRIVKQIGETAFRLLIAFSSQQGDVRKLTLAQVMEMFSADEASGASALKAISTILQTADPNEYLAIVKTVFAHVTAEREPGKGNASHAPLADSAMFQTVFGGRPKLVWQVLLPALRENYRDFFSDADSPSSPLPLT